MDSESTNLYKTGNVTGIASSTSGGIKGTVADMFRLKLKETSKGDFRCEICGSHAVKHVGGSRHCRRLRETKQVTLHMLGVLGVPLVDLQRSEFFGPFNEKNVSNSEKNVSTKKKNKGKNVSTSEKNVSNSEKKNQGKKVSTKKKGKKSSDKGKEKKSSDSD